MVDVKNKITNDLLTEELKHYKDTGIPRCQICKKDFIKISKYTWKPNCEHAKNVRLSIG